MTLSRGDSDGDGLSVASMFTGIFGINTFPVFISWHAVCSSFGF